jgi:PIN domain nuclease of toxin-antitoxin system
VRYLLDTHVWIWQVEANRRLPTRVRTRIADESDVIGLSPISTWEVVQLEARGRVQIPGSIGAWISTHRAPFTEVPLTFEVIDAMRSLDLRGFDPADAFLAATAVAYDLTLITLDDGLSSVRGLSTWP